MLAALTVLTSLVAGGCAGADSGNVAAVDPTLCPWGEARSEGEIEVGGFVYEPASAAPLAAVRVSACGRAAPVSVSDGEGSWSLALPDRDWAVIDQLLPAYIPNRCVFDPLVEGVPAFPYRIGMSAFDQDVFPMASLGLVPKEGLTWVDIDAIDLDTGLDLPGTTIDITAPYEGAVGQTEEGFFLSHETEVGFDVIFANVDPVPFDVIASHPDKAACRVPPTLRGVGSDQLNLTVYCQ